MNNNTEIKSNILSKIVIPVSLIGFSYFGIVNPILKSIGAKDTNQEKKDKALMDELEKSLPNKNYFNPSYYKQTLNGKRAMVFTQSSGDMLAKRILNATGPFNDLETIIYGAFRLCNYKTQVSFVAERFNVLYRKDLYLFLKEDVFNPTEMTNLLKITDPLPSGFIV